MKYFLILIMLLVSKVLSSTEKLYTHPFNPLSFLSLAEKYPEIFPEHEGYFFYSRIFCFDLIYRIYSNERSGHAFNFGFSKRGGRAIIQRRRSFEGGAH